LVFFCYRRMSSWYSSVTEEYRDGENSYYKFFGLVPFLQLAIQLGVIHTVYFVSNRCISCNMWRSSS
jgi:hypothetical protein